MKRSTFGIPYYALSLPEYIQGVKIEAAKRSLETSRKNVTEVMFDIQIQKLFATFSKKSPD